MGIPVKTGRTFTDHDTAESPRVIVVNESLARRVFAGEDRLASGSRSGPTRHSLARLADAIVNELHTLPLVFEDRIAES